MKKLLCIILCTALLMALSACAAKTPAAPAAEDAASTRLAELLADIAASYETGTAGCSLKAARYAGELLDFNAANAPKAEAVEDAASKFFTALNEDAKKEFAEKFGDVYYTAMQLAAGEGMELLEDGGYTPEHAPWDKQAGESFLNSLYKGMGMEPPAA